MSKAPAIVLPRRRTLSAPFLALILLSAAIDARAADAALAFSFRAPVHDLVQLAVGERFACGVTGAGGATCWWLRHGLPDGEDLIASGELADRDVQAIAAGSTHACVILAEQQEGRVHCARFDSTRGFLPLQLIDGTEGATHLALNARRGCVARHNRDVACFTLGADAQTPNLTGWYDLERIEELVVGVAQVCARQHGRVRCLIPDAPAGTAHAGPILSTQLTGVIGLAADANGTCALTEQGRTLCWRRFLPYPELEPASGNELVGQPQLPNMRQFSLCNQRLCGVSEQRAICHSGGASTTLPVIGVTRVETQDIFTCVLTDEGEGQCFTPKVTRRVKRPSRQRDSGQPEYPGALAGLMIGFGMGGGKRLAPGRLEEGVFELSLRGAYYFGRPARDNFGWGVGPVFELRSLDGETWESGVGLGGDLAVLPPAHLELRGGWGWANRPRDESGSILFASAAFGVHYPGFQDPRPGKSFSGKTIYTWPFNLYVSAHYGLEPPRVWEVTAGFETDLMIWIGMPIFLIHELVTAF